MKQVKKWRYYCDHCRKSGAAKSHMLKHELHCCHNPLRQCRMCKHATGEEAKNLPVGDAIAAYDKGGMDALKEFTSGCPACMLAAVIQVRKRDSSADEPVWIDFNYKQAVADMWSEIASERAEREDAMVPNIGDFGRAL